MSKIVHIKVFNDILDQFLDFIENDFPFLRADIVLTKNTLGFIRKGNPRMVVEQFLEYALPFEKQIFDCDEDFFLNTSLDKLGVKNKDEFLLTNKLKSIWESPQTTQVQKARVFLTFQKLLTAGKRCII